MQSSPPPSGSRLVILHVQYRKASVTRRRYLMSRMEGVRLS